MTTYTTFDPTTKSAAVVLSNGNLTASFSGGGGGDTGVLGFSSDQLSTGKYYFEVTVNTFAGGDTGIGIARPSAVYGTLGNNGTDGALVFPSGNLWINGSNTGSIGGGIASGHVVGIAVDFTAHLIWMKDVTAGGNWNSSGSNDPATGVGGRTIQSAAFVMAATFDQFNTAQETFNMGATAFTGSAPSGFTSGWPTSVQPNTWASTETPDAFTAVGYTGAFGVLGDLLVTEAKDAFAAAGFQPNSGMLLTFEATDRFSAFGFQPLTGTLSATEPHDVMHATGIGRGEDGIFVTTEAVDMIAVVGNTPVSGSFVTTEPSDRFLAIGAGVSRVRQRRTLIVT